MTGVDIAAHASEAGGASPLPTGSVETSDHPSLAAAGLFSEALAAQTEEEPPVPVAGFTPDHQPFAVGGPGGELSESESELTETTTVIPEVDVSLPLEDRVAHALLSGPVDKSATVGETPTVGEGPEVLAKNESVEGVEDRGPSGQTHVAFSRVPTPVKSSGSTPTYRRMR